MADQSLLTSYELHSGGGFPNAPFYVSLIVLLLVVIGSAYLAAEWFYHKRHGFYILWSLGLLALSAFQLPFLLANAGTRFTVTTFNVFYA
jgi:hypothetical protein